jgi:hypothetical protein
MEAWRRLRSYLKLQLMAQMMTRFLLPQFYVEPLFYMAGISRLVFCDFYSMTTSVSPIMDKLHFSVHGSIMHCLHFVF